MSTLWELSAERTWEPQAAVPTRTSAVGNGRPFRLLAFGEGTDRQVALILPDAIPGWVNGHRVVGLKVLEHRDEIHIGTTRWYYSSESSPRPITFQLSANTRRPRCVVCRVPIEDGDTVISCPRCSRLYHQLEAAGDRPAKPCFTYRDRCLCGHPTSLDGEAIWRPETEEIDD